MLKSKVINDGKEIIYANGCLHQIREQKPHFSLTGEIWKYSAKIEDKTGRDMLQGGCLHDEILKYWPSLSDLVALHLSDIDGIPMYAVENGWYWNGGSKYQEYKRDTLASYLRISEEEADRVHETCTTKEQFTEYVEQQKPRWKAEANAAIEKYDLKVKISR